ncbi:MAG TPA: hypothetical protein VIM81_20875 [Gammaproteobacteria bacterium]
MPTPSFLRILEILEKHGVEFVVVGGVAAVLHGAPVTTFDIDTLVKVSDENADRLLAALTDLEARYREHAKPISPTREDLLAGGHLLLMTNSGPLDVLGFVGKGQRYEDLAHETSMIPVGGFSIGVLDLEALIEQKRALGRDKDQAALRLLEAVLRRRR